MKAIAINKFGPPEVLVTQELPEPFIKSNEVLVKVHAASVSFGDLLIRNFKAVTPGNFNMPFLFWLYAKFYFGFFKPKVRILGSEFSGVIAETGSEVKKFSKGDSVFGYTGQKMGTYSEYISVAGDGIIANITESMKFEQAASVPYSAMMSLNLIRKIILKDKTLNGKKILIIGASRGIGLSLVQLAKYFGAKVTGVCSGGYIEFIRLLGAEKAIDYTRTDFSTEGELYDIIVDITGKSRLSGINNVLKESGSCFFVSFKMKQLAMMLISSLFLRKKYKCIILSENQKDLEVINILIENGDYIPVIDKCFPMDKSSEAHKYAESRKNKGSVIIKITGND